MKAVCKIADTGQPVIIPSWTCLTHTHTHTQGILQKFQWSIFKHTGRPWEFRYSYQNSNQSVVKLVPGFSSWLQLIPRNDCAVVGMLRAESKAAHPYRMQVCIHDHLVMWWPQCSRNTETHPPPRKTAGFKCRQQQKPMELLKDPFLLTLLLPDQKHQKTPEDNHCSYTLPRIHSKAQRTLSWNSGVSKGHRMQTSWGSENRPFSGDLTSAPLILTKHYQPFIHSHWT